MKIPFNIAEGGGRGAPAGAPIEKVGPTGRPGGWNMAEILAVVRFNTGKGLVDGLDPAAFYTCPDGSICSDTIDTEGYLVRVLYTR